MSTLLVLGTLDADWQTAITRAARRSSLEPVMALDGHVPGNLAEVRAVVLGRLASGVGSAAEWLREDERFERVAIFALGARPTAQEYVSALASGVDDLFRDPADALGVELRLQAARDAGVAAPLSLRRGLAWSIGSKTGGSVARARALRRAGFHATVLADPVGAPWLGESRLAVVVWETDDGTGALEQVRAARQAGVLCRFVLWVPRGQVAALAAACRGVDGVRVLPDTAPPDSVVFLVNEMSETGVTNQRTSERRLASEVVRFRGAGRADLGLSYNISAGGLYIRTLAPLSGGQVELEIDDGRGKTIELRCEVAWSRALSYDGTASVPPGFGVRILEASDVARSELGALALG
jgi:hypothetical protein